MQRNIIGALYMYDEIGIKPNYSELERRYGISRQTIKKYHDEGGKVLKERVKRVSKYAKHKDEIEELFSTTSTNIIGAFEYIKEKYNYSDKEFNYNGFKWYVASEGIREQKKRVTHLRYETKPGEQLQIDWKEDIEMISRHGEVFKFSLFVSTLGYSRLHNWVYSVNRTTEDFIRCLIEVFNRLGGVTNKILTDNMAVIVSIKNGYKKKHKIIKQFENDLGVSIGLTKTRTPETKGKVESANRFIKRLYAYDGNFEDENELITIIKKINSDANNQNNRTTNIPPIELFKKEKEYLSMLPNKLMLDTYISNVATKTVPNTLLVSFEGREYSVPRSYINKRVRLIPIDNELYIYYNTELVVIHKMSNKKFNYKQEHYATGLKGTLTKYSDDEINEMAKQNLELLGEIKYGK